jgi:aspartate 1-decarboxylase
MAAQHNGTPGVRRFMLKSKIHRATVTHAEVDYEGSLTLAPELLALADILPYEEVHVWNVTRGSRLRTYAIAGEPGSNVVCVNGAAAHLAEPGDLIIVATFTQLEDDVARAYKPRVVLMDKGNRVREVTGAEVPGPARRVEGNGSASVSSSSG